jgi:hypothetical protein
MGAWALKKNGDLVKEKPIPFTNSALRSQNLSL